MLTDPPPLINQKFQIWREAPEKIFLQKKEHFELFQITDPPLFFAKNGLKGGGEGSVGIIHPDILNNVSQKNFIPKINILACFQKNFKNAFLASNQLIFSKKSFHKDTKDKITRKEYLRKKIFL